MADTFTCSVVTPTGTAFEGEVTYVSLPAWDGQLGVMSGCSPILARLGSGALRLDLPGAGSRVFLVDGGFVQVQRNALTLLPDLALPAENVDREQAKADLAAAAARVTRSGENQEDVAAAQRRAYAMLAVSERFGSSRAAAG
jgi:F-type H+-transporting ATPase subunit epsilon